MQKNVPGTVADLTFRSEHAVDHRPRRSQKLRENNLTPENVVDALAKGNTIVPAGNVYIQDSMPIVANNATVVDIQRLGTIPLELGRNVYLRDVATIQDDIDITYGFALVNGKKAVYLPVIKTATGSTLSVVADTRKSMKLFNSVIPKEYRDNVKISFEFDESPTVLAAVESVATEGLIGAGLTGLMIFLFLRDLRSVVAVVVIIPLALLGSLVGLWLSGNTINIMSLGGMALSMGILVDMSTVTIENVHVQMDQEPKIATAVLQCELRYSRADPAGTTVYPVCIRAGVHHARPAPVALHAADPGGRLRHDRVVSALDHVLTDIVRVHAQAQGT